MTVGPAFMEYINHHGGMRAAHALKDVARCTLVMCSLKHAQSFRRAIKLLEEAIQQLNGKCLVCVSSQRDWHP